MIPVLVAVAKSIKNAAVAKVRINKIRNSDFLRFLEINN